MNLPPHPDRRTIDDIFGDVLPDTTADERDAGQSRSDGRSPGAGSDSEQWYLENRPPHHGD